MRESDECSYISVDLNHEIVLLVRSALAPFPITPLPYIQRALLQIPQERSFSTNRRRSSRRNIRISAAGLTA